MLEAARAELERRLSDRAGHEVTVAAIGDRDALRRGTEALRPDGQAAGGLAARATVHLTRDAVLFGPHGTGIACGNCLAMRWQRLRCDATRDALETGSGTVALAPWPVLPDFVTDAVWDLLQALPAVLPRRAGTGDHEPAAVVSLDLGRLHVRTTALLADSLCPACSPASSKELFSLSSRPKPEPVSYRLRSPADYPLPEEALINPVCGMLGSALYTGIDSPTTAPVSSKLMLRNGNVLAEMSFSGQDTSFRRSRRLAFLEGLERYAGSEHHAVLPLIDCYDNLGEAALDPRDCGTHLDSPRLTPFDPATAIPWVRGYSISEDRPIWVPARLVYYFASSAADNFTDNTSSGCAIGGCLEEAILFGLLELIERDSFLIAWYGNVPLPEISLESCDSSVIRSMRDRADLAGYELHLFDNRIDLPVPSMTSLAVRKDGGLGYLAFAAAASLDPRTAAEAAICEAMTYLPQLPLRARTYPRLAEMARDFTLVRRLLDHSTLFCLPEMAVHASSYLDSPRQQPLFDGPRPNADLLDDLLFCCRALKQAGFDVIVVDQSSPEQRQLGLHTVRVIVPGLLPIDFGWHQQRALRMPRLLEAAARATAGRVSHPADLRLVPHPFP